VNNREEGFFMKVTDIATDNAEYFERTCGTAEAEVQ